MADAVQGTELATIPSDSRVGGPLRDLRMGLMSLTPDNLVTALSQYSEMREMFRDWLLRQMEQGLHYGTPPGCEPKTKEIDGVMCVGVWNKKENCYKWYPPEQWRVKESLYKAGADFVCDLLAARDEYAADMEAWEQLGKPQGTFVFCCKLYSKLSGELLGEGRGVRKVGQKGGDENNAIKMAKKCAKVDAVLNTYGLSDLFTQDIEDDDAPPHDNPAPNHAAPKAPPRADRVTKETLEEIKGEWKTLRTRQKLSAKRDDWDIFVEENTGLPRADSLNVAAWTLADVEKCRNGVRMQLSLYDEPPNNTGSGELFGDEGDGTYAR